MCCEVVSYSDHSRAYVAAASGKKRTKPVVYMCGICVVYVWYMCGICICICVVHVWTCACTCACACACDMQITEPSLGYTRNPRLSSYSSVSVVSRKNFLPHRAQRCGRCTRTIYRKHVTKGVYKYLGGPAIGHASPFCCKQTHWR